MGYYTKNGGKIGTKIAGELSPGGSHGVYDLITAQLNISDEVPLSEASYVAIAGGGGGGDRHGGGGGAGGYTSGTFVPSAGSTYFIDVGAGGAGGNYETQNSSARGAGKQGGNTTITGLGILLYGGGGGATYDGYPVNTSQYGSDGPPYGSGGGGSGQGSGQNGMAGTSGQGFSGGDASGASAAGGGGGGASENGADASGSTGGVGGDGVTHAILNATQHGELSGGNYYIGGGGGGGSGSSSIPGGAGGLGGGGAGAYTAEGDFGPGTDEYGAGGGGTRSAGTSIGQDGGDGVVWMATPDYIVSDPEVTPVEVGGVRYYKFVTGEQYSVNFSTTLVVPEAPAEGQVLFSTPGSYTYELPSGVTNIQIALVGGGGGGGSSGSGSNAEAGGDTIVSLGGGLYTWTAGGGAAGFSNGSAGAAGAAGGTASVNTNANLNTNTTLIDAAASPTRVNSFIACGGGGAARLDGATNSGGAEFQWGGEGGTGTTLSSYPGIGTAGGAGSDVSNAKGGDGGAYGAGGGGGRDGMGGGGGALIYVVSGLDSRAGQQMSITVGAGGRGENYSTTSRRGGNGSGGAVRVMWGANRSYPSTSIEDV